jgi:hypothetical protein
MILIIELPQNQRSIINNNLREIDLDWDGRRDDFDKDWQEVYLEEIDRFGETWGVPLAVNEYGVVRWIPGGDDFIKDQLILFEKQGLNHAVWMWDPTWEPWTEEVHAMNLRFGQDPNSRYDQLPNPVLDILQEVWQLNSLRLSNFYSD